ncbi:tRNA methyltransferase [bacterium]|nr:tRNA methyltransferase [bacterium]
MIRKLSPKEVKRRNKDFEQTRDIVLIAENMTYARNVGSLFRIADALRATKVYLTGESHRPPFGKDLSKVSRGKEKVVTWEYMQLTLDTIAKLKDEGYTIIAIEQCEGSEVYTDIEYPEKIALLVGSEMFGLAKKSAESADRAVIIPMYGKGGSINVHVALAIVAFYASAK